MILNWLAFIGLAIVGYIGISLFAQLSGGQSTSLMQAAISTVKPLPLFVVIVANMFFGMALYVGFKNTPLALPAAIAIGVVTSTVYSYLILGAPLTALKIAGIGTIVVGIFLLH